MTRPILLPWILPKFVSSQTRPILLLWILPKLVSSQTRPILLPWILPKFVSYQTRQFIVAVPARPFLAMIRLVVVHQVSIGSPPTQNLKMTLQVLSIRTPPTLFLKMIHQVLHVCFFTIFLLHHNHPNSNLYTLN